MICRTRDILPTCLRSAAFGYVPNSLLKNER
jgi:hypothetical protein